MKKLKALFLMTAMSLAISLAADQTTLETSSPVASDKLGNAIAISGDYMVVGASNANKAVVFKKTDGVWAYNETLTASDIASGDEFGASVAIDGDVILVGAPGDDDNGSASGSVYVFERSTTWPTTESQKITASNGAEDDKFGVSVAVDGSVAFIGSYHDNSGSKDDSGTVYIYTKATTWDATTSLVASDSAANYKFGHSIAVNADGDRLAIGSIGYDSSKGAVYIFEKNGGSWGQAEKLTASDAAASDTFGSSVSISGLYVAVGAPAASSNAGKAYIFEKNSTTGEWGTTPTIFTGAASSTLGSSVYINGSVMIAGAPGANSASIYERGDSAWSALTWSYTSGSGSLGTSVALQNNFAFAGAPDYDGTSMTDSGAVFIKDFTLSDASILFKFDDEVLATLDGTVTDTGSTGFYGGTISGTGYAWEYIDGYNNLALVFGTGASASSKITGLNVDFGQKFVLETNIWKGDEATGQIDLVKTTDTSPTTLKWYVSSDGKMHLDLNDGTNSAAVYTSDSVLTDKEWTKLYTVVDLSQSTLANAIKMYNDGDQSSTSTSLYSLLLHFDGDISDYSSTTSPHTLTDNSTTSDTTNYKIGSASRAFDGSTSYLTIPDSNDWDMTSFTNYTFDCWCKFDSPTTGGGVLVNHHDTTENSRWTLSYNSGAGFYLIVKSSGSTIISIGYVGLISDTDWHHVALCKLGTEYGIYVDGNQVGYTDDSDTVDVTGLLYIGQNGYSGGWFNGKMDELRISKTNHFNANPNSGLTNKISVPTQGIPYSGPSLLLHFNGDTSDSGSFGNAPHTITDNSTTSDTTNYEFGAASRAFDGSSSYLSTPDSSDWDIMADKDTSVTVDFWFKADNATTGSFQYLITQYEDINNFWRVIREASGVINVRTMSGGTQKINMASSTHADTSWHHVALIRNASSNIVGLYIDGNQEAYYTMTDSDEDTYSGLLYLGQRGDGNYYFDGNIDEVRISQGNIFNAIPNSSNTDTITMPTAEDTTEYTDSDLTTTSGALSGGDYNSTTYIKDHAFDGNSTSTRWASVQEYGYVNGAAWIGNDLGESKTITGLRIKQGNGSSYGCITSAILQYYDDNSTSWVNVQTLTLLANEEWQSFVINNGISAQKWRLLANSDTNNYCWQVYQIEMFDESSSSSASSSSGGQLTLDSSSTYASGITLAPSSNAIELLQRSSADFTLKCDFIKVTANGTFSTFDTADFESESTETTSYADPNSSSAITVDATAMIKRVTNPPSDFTDGAYSGSESVTYDDGTTVFYGMFEINFGLDTSTFSGNVTVGIYIRKPEDAKFKKIGKISASAGSSMTYYWNSRAVYAGDDAGSIADDEKWTSADIGPYRSNGPVQFMFRVE